MAEGVFGSFVERLGGLFGSEGTVVCEEVVLDAWLVEFDDVGGEDGLVVRDRFWTVGGQFHGFLLLKHLQLHYTLSKAERLKG